MMSSDGDSATCVEQQYGLWVQGMARREEAAMVALYDATAPLLMAYVRQITQDRADAEEVICDTYWQAWRQAPEYDGGRGAVLAWLRMIARSRALDKHRGNRQQRLRRDEGIDLCQIADPQMPAQDCLEDREQAQVLQKALHRLPLQQRKLILAAFYDDCTHQELSERHQLPLGTVKSHIRRGLQSLRATLTELSVA